MSTYLQLRKKINIKIKMKNKYYVLYRQVNGDFFFLLFINYYDIYSVYILQYVLLHGPSVCDIVNVLT